MLFSSRNGLRHPLLQHILHRLAYSLIHRLVESCTQKCVAPNYNDGELAKGESVCLDRCFAKYVETQEQIGKKMNELQAQAMGDQPAQ